MILVRNSIQCLIGIVVVLVAIVVDQATTAFVVVAPTAKPLLQHHQQQQQHRNCCHSSTNFGRSNRSKEATTIRATIGLNDFVVQPIFLTTAAAPDTTPSWTQLTTTIAAVPTLDPTTILSDVFSNVLGTPLILAIPVVAALGVATLLAYLIVSYASPAEEED
jgi:hypothetical protein